MNLIDLKRPKPSKKEQTDAKADIPLGGYEERPYCLRFTLEAPELEKLKAKPADFSNMEPIQATVLIDPITIRDIQNKSSDPYDRKRDQSVEFQIMSISLGPMTEKKTSKFTKVVDEVMSNRGGRR